MDDAVRSRIEELVNSHPIVLFMKGNKHFPRCGFSATVAEVLRRLEVTDYQDVDVLLDQDLRQGIKEFSSWPTIPQLYVQGEFVGGCDIVREMYESGELEPVIAKATATQTE